MSEQGIFASEARHLGKSARTRGRIMDAAVSLFARNGFEATSVNEIARAADVANGTFYLHFKDKDELVAALTLRMASDVTRRISEAMADVTDAIERVARGTRHFIELAASEPDWGWGVYRALAAMPRAGALGGYMRADMALGARQKLFTVKVDDFVTTMFGAALVAALAMRLRGEGGPEIGSRCAELQLRMLGAPSARARRAAWREIAPLTLRVGQA
ncbi:MAG TPA: helix-turn-helix domain-containing protein [Rhizomicrobium sp.]|jgi:AcrR family transcriptional regulator|nr:helix-turn-helix domain-containing protein [Rhizomicrobium sp.]